MFRKGYCVAYLYHPKTLQLRQQRIGHRIRTRALRRRKQRNNRLKYLLTISKRYKQPVDIVGVGGVHAVDEGGAQGNGARLQHSRVYVLAAEAVLVEDL
jgi:hypothetical protein